MSESILSRKALEALDHHLRYWESMGSDDHQLMMRSFLSTYDPRFFDQFYMKGIAPSKQDQRVLEYTAERWTEDESRLWDYAPTMVLEQSIRDTVMEAADSMDPAPLLGAMLPARQGVLMMPNLESIMNYVTDADRDEGIERLPIRAIGWSYHDKIGHAVMGPGNGVDIWLYTDYRTMSHDGSGKPLDNLADWTKRRTGDFFIVDRVPWREGALWRASDTTTYKRSMMEDGWWKDVSRTERWDIDDDGVIQTDHHVVTMRKFMLALWAFMSDRILVTSRANLPRHNLRRLQRSGRMAQIPEDGALRIIQLRPVDWINADERESDDSAEAPFWSHRWWVRGHKRVLKSGKVVWVRPYIKGPKDRPLVLKNNVVTINR